MRSYLNTADTVEAKSFRILRTVWAEANTIRGEEVAFLEQHCLLGETALDVCTRLAKVDLTGIQAFDHAAIQHACDDRLYSDEVEDNLRGLS